MPHVHTHSTNMTVFDFVAKRFDNQNSINVEPLDRDQSVHPFTTMLPTMWPYMRESHTFYLNSEVFWLWEATYQRVSTRQSVYWTVRLLLGRPNYIFPAITMCTEGSQTMKSRVMNHYNRWRWTLTSNDQTRFCLLHIKQWYMLAIAVPWLSTMDQDAEQNR